MNLLECIREFEWDAHNKNKNFLKYRVTDQECEEIFFDDRKKNLKDALHSSRETRYVVIGRTRQQRLLFMACAIRDNKIRIISARDLNKKERHLFKPLHAKA